MAADPVEVIETAYRVELSEREWLSEVARVARPSLDAAGFGVAAWLFDARNPTRVEVIDSAFSGDDPAVHALMQAGSDALGRIARDPRADCHRFGPCQTMSQVLGLETIAGVNEIAAAMASMGACDMLGVVGIDPTGFGLGRDPAGRRHPDSGRQGRARGGGGEGPRSARRPAARGAGRGSCARANAA